MISVKRRDGQITSFDIEKITNAITLAFEACKKPFTRGMIEMLALRVTADFSSKIVDGVVSVVDNYAKNLSRLCDVTVFCPIVKGQKITDKPYKVV